MPIFETSALGPRERYQLLTSLVVTKWEGLPLQPPPPDDSPVPPTDHAWLIPLFVALILITFVPILTLWLPQTMGMIR